MAQRTPLYDWHVAHGARIVDFAGWDMPIQYTTITEEHTAVRQGVGAFDIAHMGRLVFSGPDAVPLLQKLFTNDVASMKPGQIRYGLVCNEQGAILDDVLVYRLEPFWLMVVNASNRPKIVRWIAQQQGSLQATVTDRTLDWGMLALQGPLAHKLVQAVAPQALALKYYHGVSAKAGELPIWSRTGYTGEDGWEVILPAAELAGLLRELSEKLAPQVGVQLQPCGLGARDTLRLEAGMPLYGHELSEQIDPFQADLAWAVKMDKGDFVGRAAMERRRSDSSLRCRVGLELTGKRIAREGAAVFANGKAIGQVTSGTFAPTLQKAIAMAYVDPAAAVVGSACAVDVRGKTELARVVALPFYRRAKS